MVRSTGCLHLGGRPGPDQGSYAERIQKRLERVPHWRLSSWSEARRTVRTWGRFKCRTAEILRKHTSNFRESSCPSTNLAHQLLARDDDAQFFFFFCSKHEFLQKNPQNMRICACRSSNNKFRHLDPASKISYLLWCAWRRISSTPSAQSQDKVKFLCLSPAFWRLFKEDLQWTCWRQYGDHKEAFEDLH